MDVSALQARIDKEVRVGPRPHVVTFRDQIWYLVRGAVPLSLVTALLALAEEHRNGFYNVHCKNHGDVARILLDATDAHKEELREHDDLGVLCEHPDALVLAGFLGVAWEKMRLLVLSEHDERRLGGMVEPEIARSRPGSLGQVDHMDSPFNAMAATVALHGGSTRFRVYDYQDYPDNVSADRSTVPRNWASLPEEEVDWQPGDMFVFCQNMIHRGPPNLTEHYRYVGFLGSSVPDDRREHHSDSQVYTEQVFFAFKNARSHTTHCGIW